MNFALVYPNLDATPQSLDMGVAYLATYISERTHHNLKIIDLTFHKRNWESYLKRRIKELQPDAIGISVVSLYFDYAKAISASIKKYHNVPIIAGGFQATMAPEETIATPGFDAVCIGDGEYTLEEYLKTLEEKGNLREVKNLLYKENGVVIRNELRSFSPDLDALPMPNYDLFEDIDKYLYFMKRLYVIGSRGCPYRCAFCSESVLEQMNGARRYRLRDPRKYVREILCLYNKYGKRGMSAAHVYDAVFTFNNKWFAAWADEYAKTGLSKVLPYSAFLKADRNSATKEKIKLLADSNCLQVRIGIESGDDEIRENIIKKKNPGSGFIKDVIAECNKHGLIVKTYCILGIPGDTKKSIRDTYNFCKSRYVHIPLFFSYTPIPGTPLAEKASGMHKTGNSAETYSFHFSEGAKNEGVPRRYVPWMIIKVYLVFGSRLAWNLLLSNPGIFLGRMVSRIVKGTIYGGKLSITTGHALINPEFWPRLSKRVKRRYRGRGI